MPNFGSVDLVMVVLYKFENGHFIYKKRALRWDRAWTGEIPYSFPVALFLLGISLNHNRILYKLNVA